MHATSPKRRFQTPAQCLKGLPSSVLLFIFPLPRKNGGKRLFISKGIGTHPSKENTEKKEKKGHCAQKVFRISLSCPL